MLFAEQYARLLLVVHAILAAGLVAASTHLVVWMRGFPRGKFQRIQAVRKFAVITASLFAITLLFGNLIYPVYKVRVRLEYLERPDAVVRDHASRLDATARTRAERNDPAAAGAAAGIRAAAAAEDRTTALPHHTARIARWFDVKEHWVALGMALSLGCALVLLWWNPGRHGPAIAPVVFLMAVGAAGSAWLGAIIGLVVTSYRSIGSL